jgi:hypothetical protein
MTEQELMTEIVLNGRDAVLKKYNWIPYYGYYIHQSWIDEGKPYDKMAIPWETVVLKIVNEQT